MSGSNVNNYLTIVMDGSDENVVRNICTVIDGLTKEEYGKSVCSHFDCKHPTLICIDTTTKEEVYDVITKVIESLYPGLCVFNPATN